MKTDPDGSVVVASVEDIHEGKSAPLLILDRVTVFLDRVGMGDGPVRWEQIGNGQSNVTFRLRRGRHDVVLRRGPRPPLPPSTHDMIREARVQSILHRSGFPVPHVLAVCEDPTLLGVPFYLMEYIDGTVITDKTPTAFDSAPERLRVSERVVDSLVELHGVDIDVPEWSTLGRPAGYLARQVQRFAALSRQATQRDLAAVDQLAEWLGRHLPESQTPAVVHGDYRLGNVMFRSDAPATVRAVLDWEMATLGDPLADLGYLTATWADARFQPTVMELTPVTRDGAYLDRDGVIARYADQRDVDVSALPWYQALALWKSAIFSEAIYNRWRNGERADDATFASALEHGVSRLLDAAAEAAGIVLTR